jgi:hypothetical protein
MERLTFRGFPIPESGHHAGRPHLAFEKGLRSLGVLFVRGTQVTDVGVKDLEQALPGLRIIR